MGGCFEKNRVFEQNQRYDQIHNPVELPLKTLALRKTMFSLLNDDLLQSLWQM